MTRESSDNTSTEGAGRPAPVSRAEHQAIQWVVCMTSGEATEADRTAFAQWLAESPEHQAALAMARRLWVDAGRVLPARSKVAARPQWRPLALAASVLLVVALGYTAFYAWRDDAVAGHNSIAQSDAAHVMADSRAALEVDDAAGRCRLVLGRGEAFFDVTPNPDRLVAGAAGETQVRVLDTAFSVRPEASGVLVTVTVGRVEVNDGNAARVLTVGQQLRCRASRDQAVIPAGPGVDGLTVSMALPGSSRSA